MTKKPTEKARKAAVRKWSATPTPNPRYRGATPSDVGRALLGKRSTSPTRPASVVGPDRDSTGTE